MTFPNLRLLAFLESSSNFGGRNSRLSTAPSSALRPSSESESVLEGPFLCGRGRDV